MIYRTATLSLLAIAIFCFASSDVQAQLTSIGNGQGISRFGPYGIQYGGGQGYRIGPPNIGVQYGGGQGVRYGTPYAGVQYGGGQILRWGTPNACLLYTSDAADE